MSSLALRHERDSDGIVSLWVDQPEKPVVILDSWLLEQIALFLDWVDDGPAPAGFILHSTSDRVFIAGADLNEIGGLDDAGLDAYLQRGQQIFNRIEQLPCPTVAAISGDALGGGLEISLACQYRVAAAPAGRVYQIGLPEAKLGIVPGWGGTQRLPAIVNPVSVALGRMTTGRTFTPAAALRVGLVDALAPADELDAKARALIVTNPKAKRPRVIQDRADNVRAALAWAESCRTRPVRRLPAVGRVLDAVRIGLDDGLEAGLDAERRFLVELRSTPESRDMLGAFFARTGTVRAVQKRLTEQPAPAERVAIIGDSPLADFLARRLGRKAQVERLSADSTSSDAQVFIEAAGDERTEQLAALRFVSALASDEAVIMTTSPILGLDEIAGSVTHASRIVGLAPGRPFGSNAACELIRGEQTTDATVGAALSLCKMLGLVPIVQRVGGPSLMTRLFGQVAIDAFNLALETRDPHAVDRAARAEGATSGPLATLDRIGLVAAATMVGRADQLQGATRVFGADGQPDPAFMNLAPSRPAGGSGDFDHYYMSGLSKAARDALDAGLVDSVEEIRLACTFGLGLAPWRTEWLTELAPAVRG